MALSGDITITIVAANPGLTLAGFGIDLIAGVNMAWVERTRSYNGIAGVGGDFATTTPEWQAANVYFAQNPAPTTLMIGKCTNKPTQVFQVSIATVVNVAGTAYKIRLNNLGTGATGAGIGVFATFTTVGADSNDSIITGLQAAVTALAVPGLTASIAGAGGSHVLILTMTVGLWLGVEVFDVATGAVGGLMTMLETTTDPGLTADLVAINTESSVWYGLTTLFKSAALITAAASWVESNQKLYIPATADTIVATTNDSGATDIAHTLKGSARDRTAVFYHPRNDEFADIGEVGVFFPKNPGTENWRKKPISGPTPVMLTATQMTNLQAKLCNYYFALTAQGSANSISCIGGNGQCASGKFIDFRRFCDWWSASVATGLENLELTLDKIAFTDDGIAQVEGVIRQVNAIGQGRGAIARVPAPTISSPQAINVPTADKLTRTLNGVLVNFTYTGAINKINVTAAVGQ